MNTPKLCGNCRHFSLDAEVPGWTKPDGYGSCQRIKSESTKGAESDAAFAQDASHYWAAIICRSDFGCVLWEGKQ